MSSTGTGDVTHLTSGRDPYGYDGLQAYEPDWSPDGKKIAYTDSDFVWVINVANKEEQKLKGTYSEWTSSPTWSPDGSTIVCEVWRYYGPFGLIKVKADGTRFGDGSRYHVVRKGDVDDPDWGPKIR